jgi:methylmalonyl-CoA/ethylmalonyl-CoA epimerase
MIERLDHVGAVTGDLTAARTALATLDFERYDKGVADAYGVACEFWRPGTGPGTAVELVAPIRDGAAVSGHLKRRGPGLHHLAVEVGDVEAALARLRRQRVVLVDTQPQSGAREGMRVAFVHMGPATNLLVELVDYRGSG